MPGLLASRNQLLADGALVATGAVRSRRDGLKALRVGYGA